LRSGFWTANNADGKQEKALRKGRLFREVKQHRLRQNQGTAIGSKRKPTPVEELKMHREMTRAQAGSCGELQARCGKLVAIGDVLRLRSASFVAENRVGGGA
jgi:hypothetical protein